MNNSTVAQQNINISFSAARVFAIISIVAAHINFDAPENIFKIVNSIGSVGVIAFIVMSAYFFHSEKSANMGNFFLKKVKTIIIPWIFMGTIVFMYNAILAHKAITPISWLIFILGNKSFLYYLTMLMLCYIIFYKRNIITISVAFIVNIVSVYLTAAGKLNGIITDLHITNYLNIFNWVGYFALGCVLQNIKPEKLYRALTSVRIPVILVFAVCWAGICVFKIPTGYFSYVGMPFQLLGCAAIFCISTMGFQKYRVVHTISNMTFGIYLMHMIIIGLCDRLYLITTITKLFSPVIVVVICCVILYAGYIVCKLIKIDKLYCMLTGIRMNRNIKEK